MTDQITVEQVIEAMKGIGDVDASKLDHDVDLTKQGYDSLDMIDILFNLQEKFGFEVSEDSIAENEWSSVNKIVLQVNNLLAGLESKNA